ncbi:DUF397 domain-containing protein [Streptomyces sp. NPDC003393]
MDLHPQAAAVVRQQPQQKATAGRPTAIHLRDSKTPEGPHLTVAPAAWTAFLELAARPE